MSDWKQPGAELVTWKCDKFTFETDANASGFLILLFCPFLTTEILYGETRATLHFSHTTGSHAKPNHAAWPLFVQQNVTKQYKESNGYMYYKPKHLKREIIWPHKGLTTKKKGRNHGYQAQKTNKPTTGGWEGGQAQRTATRKLKTTRIMWPRPPAHTSTQTPRCVWEKRFPLHSFLSQRKTTLLTHNW